MRKLLGFLKRKLLSLGLGAGMLGALVVAIRFAKKPRPQVKLPESISPAIFATRMLYTSRGQMVYHESGQGDPLIFLHGVYLGASSYEWSKVYPHFADRFQVIAPDLIGFGESERSPLSLEDHVRSLGECLRAKCGEARAAIVASGLGAVASALLAEQHPELVQRLVLFMPVDDRDLLRQYVPRRLRTFARLALRNDGFYRRHFASERQIRDWLTRFGFAEAARIDHETVDVLTRSAQQFGAQRAVLHWLLHKEMTSLERIFAGLTQPVTLLWADKATVPGVEFGRRLQRIPRHCSLVTLEHCGILAALEVPAQMIQVLDQELGPGLRLFTSGQEQDVEDLPST